MKAVPVFENNATDFTTNGLGLLQPKECIVSEIANGLYEAELVQPIHEDGKFELLKRDRILRLPVPVRESPLYAGNTDTTKTVQRRLFRVETSGLRLRLRTAPNFDSATIGYYSSGTEVIEIGDPSGDWINVTVRNGGATGWMHSDNLTYITTITDTITSGTPGQYVQVQPTREQLFRIYNVETNSETKLVTVKAFHIFYDLRGNVINADLTTKGVDAAEAARNAFNNLLNPTNFHLYTLNLEGRGIVKGQYSYMGIIEAMLDPDNGMVPKANAYLIRDNWDVFMIPPVERDLGVTIRRRKNLVGVTVTDDFSSVVTRIIPVGKDKDGKNLKLPGDGTWGLYVDSAHINDYANIYAQKIDYDVTEVKTAAEADPDDGKYYGLTGENGCYAALLSKAAQSYVDGIDLPEYRMDVNFLLLGNTEEYKEFANLQAVHMFDTITIIDELVGITAKLRVTGYEWDAVNEQYISVTLGDISKLEKTVAGYNIQSGSITGQHIVEQSVDGGTVIRDHTIIVDNVAYDFGEKLDISTNQTVSIQSGRMDELAARIQVMNDAITQLVQQVDGQGSTLSTAITQNSTQITAAITRISEIAQDGGETADNLDELRTLIETYFTFSEDGLKIGQSGNPFSFRVDERQLGFYVNDTLVAYMQNDKLHIDNAEIGNLRLKDYGIEEPDTKNLTFYWYGQEVV